MPKVPRHAVHRGAKLASVPLGAAGRAVLGWGQRLAGGDADLIAEQWSAHSANQIFAVLSELKGGAMKFGQAMSIYEAAIPEQLAAPYREALTKLQASAQPMSTQQVHRVLDAQLGVRWRDRFAVFDDDPVAAASDSGVEIQPEDVLTYFGPFAAPLWEDRFQFSRDWLQQQAPRLPGLARGQDFLGAPTLNIPAEHALMFRTLVGLVAVACQLEAEVALRDIVVRWYPDFAEPKFPPAVADALGSN